MAEKSAAAKIFDKALLLKDEEILTLRFDTYSEMMSKKTLLFRERKKYQDRFLHSDSYVHVSIVKDTTKKHKGIFMIHLGTTAKKQKDRWVEDAVVHTYGGKEEPVVLVDAFTSEVDRVKWLKKVDSEIL